MPRNKLHTSINNSAATRVCFFVFVCIVSRRRLLFSQRASHIKPHTRTTNTHTHTLCASFLLVAVVVSSVHYNQFCTPHTQPSDCLCSLCCVVFVRIDLQLCMRCKKKVTHMCMQVFRTAYVLLYCQGAGGVRCAAAVGVCVFCDYTLESASPRSNAPIIARIAHIPTRQQQQQQQAITANFSEINAFTSDCDAYLCAYRSVCSCCISATKLLN